MLPAEKNKEDSGRGSESQQPQVWEDACWGNECYCPDDPSSPNVLLSTTKDLDGSPEQKQPELRDGISIPGLHR